MSLLSGPVLSTREDSQSLISSVTLLNFHWFCTLSGALFLQPTPSYSFVPFGPPMERHNPLSLLPASSHLISWLTNLPGLLPVQPTSSLSRPVWSTRGASKSFIYSSSLLAKFSWLSELPWVLPVQPTSVRLVHPQSFTAPYLFCHFPQVPLALHTASGVMPEECSPHPWLSRSVGSTRESPRAPALSARGQT